MPTYKETLDDFLYDSARRGHRATLGKYVFYLNPDSIDGKAVRNHLEYVTLNGGGSMRYPTMPEVWTLQGHTGIKGANELQKLYGTAAPTDTKPEVLLPFTFKPIFLNTLYVLVNSFERSMTNDRHLYCKFQMEMLVLPRPRPPSYRRNPSSVQLAAIQNSQANITSTG